jgi:hypothetical protein
MDFGFWRFKSLSGWEFYSPMNRLPFLYQFPEAAYQGPSADNLAAAEVAYANWVSSEFGRANRVENPEDWYAGVPL